MTDKRAAQSTKHSGNQHAGNLLKAMFNNYDDELFGKTVTPNIKTTKRLINQDTERNPIIHEGHYEPGDGDMMMKRTLRNFGPDDIDKQSK